MFFGGSGLASAQQLVLLVLGVLAFVTQVYALVDCLRQRSDAFVAASKQTKQLWMIILAVATAIGFVSILGPLNIFNLIAFVAASVYLVDVRPALRSASGRGGGGSHMGPYGPW
jgi:Kef-type K+ transport system membrane component KefB